jgi:hypothetical protein
VRDHHPALGGAHQFSGKKAPRIMAEAKDRRPLLQRQVNAFISVLGCIAAGTTVPPEFNPSRKGHALKISLRPSAIPIMRNVVCPTDDSPPSFGDRAEPFGARELKHNHSPRTACEGA